MSQYPKIGIRPAIDGRQGGVRESLEEQTMRMAQAARELIARSARQGGAARQPRHPGGRG